MCGQGYCQRLQIPLVNLQARNPFYIPLERESYLVFSIGKAPHRTRGGRVGERGSVICSMVIICKYRMSFVMSLANKVAFELSMLQEKTLIKKYQREATEFGVVVKTTTEVCSSVQKRQSYKLGNQKEIRMLVIINNLEYR